MAADANHPEDEPGPHPDHFVREWREFMGWSQEELGEMASVHYTTIGRIETGKRKLKTRFLRQLAEIFGVLPSALLEVDPSTPEGARTANMLIEWHQLNATEQDQILRQMRGLTRPDDKSNAS